MNRLFTSFVEKQNQFQQVSLFSTNPVSTEQLLLGYLGTGNPKEPLNRLQCVKSTSLVM